MSRVPCVTETAIILTPALLAGESRREIEEPLPVSGQAGAVPPSVEINALAPGPG